MRKQYIAEYQHAHSPEVWSNASTKMNKRYFDTLEEAQAALSEAKAYFNGKPRTTTNYCGLIGITAHTDSKSAKGLMITKTRIRVREVTEWEVVEEA